MRIKQNKLPARPDKYYVRYVNGIHAIVCLYHEPCYCVNVITHDGKEETRHCHPLTKRQYDIYMEDNPAKQMEMIAKGGKIFSTRQEDNNVNE